MVPLTFKLATFPSTKRKPLLASKVTVATPLTTLIVTVPKSPVPEPKFETVSGLMIVASAAGAASARAPSAKATRPSCLFMKRTPSIPRHAVFRDEQETGQRFGKEKVLIDQTVQDFQKWFP